MVKNIYIISIVALVALVGAISMFAHNSDISRHDLRYDNAGAAVAGFAVDNLVSETLPSTTCFDTDGGIKESTSGTVSGASSSGQTYMFTDSCSSEMLLNEYYCTNGYFAISYIECPNTCYNGVCLSQKPVRDTGDSTPRISYWWGKVNQHTENGLWVTDPDGVSGADIDMLKYCRKWYPETLSYEAYKMETFSGWKDRGNLGEYTSTKQSYRCVQPSTDKVPIIYDFYYKDFCGDGVVGINEECESGNLGYKGTVFITLRMSGSVGSAQTVILDGQEYYILLSSFNPDTRSLLLSVNGEKSTLQIPNAKTIAGVYIHVTEFHTAGTNSNVTLAVNGKQIQNCAGLSDYFESGSLSCTSDCKHDTSGCEAEISETCTDSDGGKNPTVYGKACLGDSCGYDYCNYDSGEDNVLVDRICLSNNITGATVICSGSTPYCYEGVCSSTKPSCTDSDGGIESSVLGSVQIHHIPEIDPYTDYCEIGTTPVTSCSGSTCSLREFYCFGLMTGFTDVSCPDGCTDGVCTGTPSSGIVYTYDSVCGDGIVGLEEDCDGDNIRSDDGVAVSLSSASDSRVISLGGNQYTLKLIGWNTEYKSVVISVNGVYSTLYLSQQRTISNIGVYVQSMAFDGTKSANVTFVIKGAAIEHCSDLDSRFSGGDLSCTDTCAYDVSSCTGANSTGTCSDSDGGEFYYVKGTTHKDTAEEDFEVNDSCYDSSGSGRNVASCTGTSCQVSEHFCTLPSWTGYYQIGVKYVDCPNGCSDGACISKLKYTLADYPQPFITEDGIATALFIVGRNAKVDDVIGITDIVASLQRYAADNPFPVGIVKFDDEAYGWENRNLVLVGGMCANSIVADLYGNPSDCTHYDTKGVGKIEIIQNKNKDNYVLLVHGYNAEDTMRAARVLANWHDYQDEFNDASALCVTGTLTSMQVKEC